MRDDALYSTRPQIPRTLPCMGEALPGFPAELPPSGELRGHAALPAGGGEAVWGIGEKWLNEH